MKILNQSSSSSAEADDVVVVTNLSAANEQALASRIVGQVASYGSFLSGNLILVRPETESMGLDYAQRLSGIDSSTFPGDSLPVIGDIQVHPISSSSNVVQYSYRPPENRDLQMQVAFIPGGSIVAGFTVWSVRDANFEESVFETIYDSFRFI